MSQSSEHSTQHIYRYPGIQPFSRAYRKVFFGRIGDIEGLHKYLNVNKLVVLYGKSGLGKSSLLNAGLIPKIEEEQALKTVFVRFGSFHGTNQSLLRQTFIQRIHEAQGENADAFLSEVGIDDYSVSIWQHLKSLQWQFRHAPGLLLVLDQFEEVFTYPEGEVHVFGEAFSEVVNNRMPERFRKRLYDKAKEDPDFLQAHSEEIDFIADSPPLKILIGIRSDRLSLLDRFSAYLPNILKNTYELRPLSLKQARQAITKPVSTGAETGDPDIEFRSPPFRYEPELVTAILDYLSRDGSRPVETFLLQIICQHIEEHILGKYGRQPVEEILVTKSEIGELDDVARNYYVQVIEGVDSETDELRFTLHQQLLARYFIESQLIDSSHHNRISLDKSFVSQMGFPDDMLDKLVDARIIRQEPNTVSGVSYELSHDTLIDPVLQSPLRLGNLEDQIGAYYNQYVGVEEQRFVEGHLILSEGQLVCPKLDAFDERELGILNALRSSSIVRDAGEDQYELYRMFATPAMKRRASRAGKVLQTERKKRRRATLAAVGAGVLALIAIIATFVANRAMHDAHKARAFADEARIAAVDSSRVAIEQRRMADEQRYLAESNAVLADSLRGEAIGEKAIAERESIRARKEAARAEREALEAKRQGLLAEKQKNIAEEQRLLAELKGMEAESARLVAEARLQEIYEKNQEIFEQEKLIEVQPFLTRSRDALDENPTVALNIAKHAYGLQQIDSTEQMLYEILGNNNYRLYRRRYTKPDHIRYNNDYYLFSFLGWCNSVFYYEDSSITVFDPISNQLFTLPGAHSYGAYSRNGTHVLTRSKSNSKIWDSSGKHISTIPTRSSIGYISSGEELVLTSEFSEFEGQGIALPQLWDIQGSLITTIPAPGSVAVFFPNDQLILTTSHPLLESPNVAKIWNLEGKQIALIQNPDASKMITFSAGGQVIVTCSPEDNIPPRVWDLEGNLLVTIPDSGTFAMCTSDLQYVLTSGDSRNVNIWNIKGELIRTFETHMSSSTVAILSPNEQYVLAFDEYEMQLWDINKETLLQNYFYSKKQLPLFSHDGSMLFAFTRDGILEWDTFPSNSRQKIIKAYQAGIPFPQVKDLIEAYLESGEFATVTGWKGSDETMK